MFSRVLWVLGHSFVTSELPSKVSGVAGGGGAAGVAALGIGHCLPLPGAGREGEVWMGLVSGRRVGVGLKGVGFWEHKRREAHTEPSFLLPCEKGSGAHHLEDRAGRHPDRVRA